jgi:hypothetical protein
MIRNVWLPARWFRDSSREIEADASQVISCHDLDALLYFVQSSLVAKHLLDLLLYLDPNFTIRILCQSGV